MRKRMTAFLLGTMMVFATVMPAFAVTSTSAFTLGTVNGSATLTKTTNSATGKTAFGVGKSVTAERAVTVKMTCTKTGKTYTYSEKSTASTNAGNYDNTTAVVIVNRPTSKYTVKSANSSHSVSTWTETWSKKLSA